MFSDVCLQVSSKETFTGLTLLGPQEDIHLPHQVDMVLYDKSLLFVFHNYVLCRTYSLYDLHFIMYDILQRTTYCQMFTTCLITNGPFSLTTSIFSCWVPQEHIKLDKPLTPICLDITTIFTHPKLCVFLRFNLTPLDLF